MEYIRRIVEGRIRKALDRNKSVLLLGPRQTGKTTLLNRLHGDFNLSFVKPDVRQRYEKEPSLLAGEVEALKKEKKAGRPLVLLDEVQKVPPILDVAQDLIDRGIANFVLTGSSARKLRRGPGVNLLPGRVVSLRLDPLILAETPEPSLRDLILYGSLPGILRVRDPRDREIDLESYVTSYLEEEVRAEALVRNLGSFARFLEYAASESGRVVNFRKLSQEIGVAHTTIVAYYQILEDCLIAERVEPLTKSRTRKRLTRAQKYLFFDLGVRRISAKEGDRLPKENLGELFEQWVGLELLRTARLSEKKIRIRFWRDPDGPEVDWILEKDGFFIPVEVKWTDSPSKKEVRNLKVFLKEYPNSQKGYLVCRTPQPVQLEHNLTAIPWHQLDELITAPQR